jgi:hypothetical protein
LYKEKPFEIDHILPLSGPGGGTNEKVIFKYYVKHAI